MKSGHCEKRNPIYYYNINDNGYKNTCVNKEKVIHLDLDALTQNILLKVYF